MYPDWGPAEALIELRAHQRGQVPFTLVLHADSQLLGSVSVLTEDPPASPSLTPWLANLYVKPQARGRGGGQTLVAGAVRHAASLGIERLYLFTLEHEAFYASLGWTTVAQVNQASGPFTVMLTETASSTPAGRATS